MPERSATPPPPEAATPDACEAVKRRAVTDARGAVADADRLILAADAPRDRVRALGARAHARCYANDFAGAVADLSEALAIAQASGVVDEAPNLRLVSVQPLARAGRLADALHAATLASAEFRALGQPVQQGKAEVNRGVVLRMRGDARAALACFDDAAALLGDDPALLGACHCNRAVALLELDRHPDALAAFRAALAALGPSAPIVHGNIADLLGRMGRTAHAVAEFERARELYRAAGAAADEARLAAEEAEALASAGASARAADLYRDALPALESLPREHTRALLGLGLVQLALGRPADADATLRRAVDRAGLCQASLLQAEALAALARARSASGDHAQAVALIQDAARGLRDRPIRFMVACISAAEIELAAGRLNAAAASLQGLDAPGGPQVPLPIRASLHYARSRLATARGDRLSALADLQAAVAALEAFRLALSAPVIRAAMLEASRGVYLDLATTALDTLEPARALPLAVSAIERVRARTLMDALRDDPASPDAAANPSDAPEPPPAPDRQIVEELNVLYASLGPAPAPGSGDTSRRLARLRELESALEVRSLARSAGRAPGLTSEPTPLDQLVSHRPDDAVMVLLFDDGPDLSAIVLGPQGPAAVRRLVPRAEIRRLRGRFELELARALAGFARDQPPLLAHPAAIARRVFEPLEPLLGPASRLIVSLCPLLENLPIQALHPAGLTPRRIDLVPTLSLAPLPHAAGGTPRSLIVAVADDAAPAIVDEAREVASVHDRPTLLVADQATSHNVLDQLPHADLVHLACHAVFDPRFPLSSRLALADRWVTARELLGRLRPGATVVLAGCHSGASSGTDDSMGLHRAAIASGAAAVLSSLWPLHDQTARELLPQLHTRLVQRTGPLPLRLGPALADVLASAHLQRIPAHLWANLTVTGAAA